MKRIFILEDSKTESHRLTTLLVKNGYDVVGTAETGAHAVEMVPELKPDLMFADIILKEPEMDGIDAAVEIKKRFDVPVIFLTNYSDENLVSRTLRVAPYAYLIKPINEDQLRVTLETIRNRLKMEKERDALAEQLNHSQKMEAIGQLAGGMAHNFNNILSVILGNAEMALRKMAPEDPCHPRVKNIIKAGVRAKDFSTNLLALSRKEKINVRPVNAGELIEDVLELLKAGVSKKITMRTSIDDSLPPLNADTNQLIQAILNICINACDSMPDGGTLTIETGKTAFSIEEIKTKSGLQPGEYILIRVTDTGHGIPESILEKVFEPFFTTKEKDTGTGLGLYITQHIITSHNGHIGITSREGRGTTAEILLPVSAEQASASRDEHAATQKTRGDETILIVDDEEDFLEVISETFRSFGYKTYTANRGGRALALFAEHREEIDLVLLDIMMPEMDGGEVFHALKDMTPDVKVVLCSGFSNKGKAAELMAQGVAAFIQKPFVFEELETTISNVLCV